MTRDSSHHAGADSRPDEDLDALLYGELRALAADFLRRERSDHMLQPTALVHEAWIRLSAQAGSPWDAARSSVQQVSRGSWGMSSAGRGRS